MKKPGNSIIECVVDKTQGITSSLDFIHVGHRHFEKELPNAVSVIGGSHLYRLPIDLVSMVIPSEKVIIDSIEEVLVCYGKE